MTVFAAAGFGTIIMESVGVRQSEVGILNLADVVVVVLNPGAGDEIQALKAGVMEIGDLYVINKADYPEADALERVLKAAVEDSAHAAIRPRVLRTIAVIGAGVDELYRVIGERLEALHSSGELEARRQRRITGALKEIAGDLFGQWVPLWIEADGRADPGGGASLGTFRRELAAALETIAIRKGCLNKEDVK